MGCSIDMSFMSLSCFAIWSLNREQMDSQVGFRKHLSTRKEKNLCESRRTKDGSGHGASRDKKDTTVRMRLLWERVFNSIFLRHGLTM